MAWAVMVGAFGIFLAGAAGVPWAAARYLHNATAPEWAVVERKEGAVTLERQGVTVLLEPGGRQSATAGEGTAITTHGDGRAHVRLFDDSTLNLEPNARIRIDVMRRPQFAQGSSAARVVLWAERLPDAVGRLTLATTWAPTLIELHFGQATATLSEQSRVRLTLEDGLSRVYALEGSVDIRGATTTVTVPADRVSVIPTAGEPGAPRSALANIIANNDFRRPPQVGWTPRAGGEPLGVFRAGQVDRRRVLVLERIGADGRPGDIVLEQSLGNRELSDASFLGVSATFRIDVQSLAAGGERDTEYPLILKMVVERQDGSQDRPWEVGFYAADGSAPQPALSADLGILGIPVPAGTWLAFGSGNLLESDATPALAPLEADTELPLWPAIAERLARIERFQPGPQRLIRFELKASGHDWATYVERVGVWVK